MAEPDFIRELYEDTPIPEKVDVIDPSGRVGSVPAAQMQSALRLGYRVAKPEEIRHHDLQERYGGVGDTIAAFGTGALGGLTAGLSDAVIAEAGGREYLQGLEEVHPVARGAGNIAGMVGGLALGGEGAAARAAEGGLGGAALAGGRLLSAPTRAIGAIGEGTERLLGGGLLGSIGRGAAEGAAFGASDAFSRSVVADEELKGEALGAAMWQGALMGGGGAAAIALPSKALGWAAGKARDFLTKGGANRVEDSALGLIRNPVAREQAVYGAKELPRVAEEMLPGVGKVFDAEELVSSAFKQGAKVRQVAEKMTLSVDDAARLASEDLSGLRTKIAELRSSSDNIEAGLGRSQQVAGNAWDKVEDTVAIGSRELNEVARKGGSAAEYYEVLDRTKRSLGLVNESLATERVPRIQDVYNQSKGLYDIFRKNLEDPRKWGEVGHLQAKMNASWDRSLQDQEVLGYGKNIRGPFGEDKWVLNDDKVRAAMLDPEKGKNLDSWLTRAKGRLQTAKENLVLGAGESEKLYAALEAIDGLREKVGTAQNTIKNAENLQGMRSRGTVLRSGLAGGVVVHGLMGTSMFSPAGMAASALVGAAVSPGHVVSGLAHAQRAAEKFAAAVNSDVAKAFGKAVKVTAGRAVGVVGREYQRELDTRKARVLEWAAQPDVVASEAARALTDLPPELEQGAVGVALRAHQVLASSIAKPGDVQGNAAWLSTAKLLDNPKDLVKRIFAGEVTLDQVKALAQVFPKQTAAIQKRMLGAMVDMEAKGKTLPPQMRLALSFVGIPADPFAKFTKSLQSTYAPTNRPPPPGSKVQRPPDVTSLWQTQESRGYRGK